MSGATLIPDYYKAKMKLCVMLAPPASMSNNSVQVLNLMSKLVNRAIITSMLDTIHLWSLLPYGYAQSGIAVLACSKCCHQEYPKQGVCDSS
jgi:hypothetical protein